MYWYVAWSPLGWTITQPPSLGTLVERAPAVHKSINDHQIYTFEFMPVWEVRITSRAKSVSNAPLWKRVPGSLKRSLIGGSKHLNVSLSPESRNCCAAVQISFCLVLRQLRRAESYLTRLCTSPSLVYPTLHLAPRGTLRSTFVNTDWSGFSRRNPTDLRNWATMTSGLPCEGAAGLLVGLHGLIWLEGWVPGQVNNSHSEQSISLVRTKTQRSRFPYQNPDGQWRKAAFHPRRWPNRVPSEPSVPHMSS